METQNGNTCKCDVCSIDVHRASIAKHLKRKKHLDKEKVSRSNFSMNPIYPT